MGDLVHQAPEQLHQNQQEVPHEPPQHVLSEMVRDEPEDSLPADRQAVDDNNDDAGEEAGNIIPLETILARLDQLNKERREK